MGQTVQLSVVVLAALSVTSLFGGPSRDAFAFSEVRDRGDRGPHFTPITEVFEPSARHYPSGQYAKVAVLSWLQREWGPLPATPAQAEAYKGVNRSDLASWMETAAKNGAELVVTPEFGVTGYPYADFSTPADVAPYVETIPGPSTAYFGDLAQRLKIYVVFDLAEDGGDGAYYNAQVLMAPDGSIAGHYRKENLFGTERRYLSPGKDISVVNTPFGRVGMMICADVYGSVVDRYDLERLDAVIVSAAWTIPNAAMGNFADLAKNLGVAVIASNLADYPDSGVVSPDGTAQSHIRQTIGLAYGYVKRK